MTNPTIPNVPFPLIASVATVFKDWEKYLQQTSNEFVNVVAYKLVMFSLKEVVYSFGYLWSVAPGDVITGEARVEGEDYNWNPETAFHGGDSLGPGMRHKLQVTAKLETVNGHPQIAFNFGSLPSPYMGTLTTVSGHDPYQYFPHATILTGDRSGIIGGRVMGSFLKDNIEKTHWQPSF